MNDNPAREELERKISVLEKEIKNLKRTVEDLKKKEDLYEKAEEICNYGHWSRDYNTNEGMWSKNVYRIFGVKPGEFDPSTENFLSLVHPSDREGLSKSIHESISQHKTLDIIYRIVRPDKNERFIHSVADPFFVSKDQCPQLLGTVQDITERQRVEDALHASEQKFSTVFLSNPASIAITRLKDNRLVDINRAWEEKTGFSREEILGHTTFELNLWVNPEDRQIFINQILKEDKFQNVETQLRDKKGRILFMLMSGQLVNIAGEECLLTMGQDITEQKMLINQLKESEQRYRSLFENSLTGIVQALPNGQLIAANNAFARMYGYDSPREMLTEVTDAGKNLYADPHERTIVLRELAEKGALKAREFEAVRRDGSRFFVMVTAHEIKDAEGRLLCYQATHLDITERKNMEEKLKAVSLYTRNLIEASLDPLVTISPDGKIMDVNNATEVVTGVVRENLIGSDFSDYFTEPEKARKGYRQAYSKGIVKDYPLSIRHVSGHIADVLYNASVYRNDCGEVQGVFAAARDITEHKKIDKERARLRSELFQAQKLESLGTLVAGVAHEINNPINTIMNNAPLLQRVWRDMQPVLEECEKNGSGRRYGGLTYEFLQNNMDQLISDIEQSANRVASIARGLKDFSRKTTSLEKLPVNINATIENAVRLAGSSLHTSGIELAMSLEPDLPTVLASTQSLEQIALNLIVNAVQAIDHDHGYIKIATANNEKTGTATMTVEDNGRGIDSSVSDKIFDPFFTGRQKEGGTGLGLSITHNLVKINNGTISFNSQKGKGTIFSISFPTRPAISPAKILLVDDEEAILKVMEKALTRDKDYLIEKATNGNDALIKMGIFSPDLLILDIFMPEMDGVEVIRAIKNHPEMEDMKIIVVSGHIEHEKIKQVIKIGVFKVFSKPIEMKELLTNVKEALKER